MSATSTDSGEAALRTAFTHSVQLPPSVESNLAGAVAHALENPGSMLRARICHRLSLDLGLSAETAVNLALSVELFHTASLLFDDLPCMDDASERRGAPCAHKTFGEGAAILASLALINRAYALLWKALESAPRANRAEASAFAERCLGVAGILNGQSCDLHFTSVQRTRSRVLRVAIGKTVSLIRLTLVLPATLAGSSPAERRLLSKLSVFWGLAYQVVDDLKDVLAAAKEVGKTTHRDDVLGRPNLALSEGPLRTSKLLARLALLGDATLLQAADTRVFCALNQLRQTVAAHLAQAPRQPIAP